MTQTPQFTTFGSQNLFALAEAAIAKRQQEMEQDVDMQESRKKIDSQVLKVIFKLLRRR